MRAEEFITILVEKSTDEEAICALRAGIPLGVDGLGNTVLSQCKEHGYTVSHTCVTGARRTTFIRRLLMNLSCLYAPTEANFFILSPRNDYGELLRLQSADVTAPYLRDKSDLDESLRCLRELISLYRQGRGYPRLILVLDGLEELDGCNGNGDLEEYRTVFETLAREKNVDVISGVELMKSIFSGNPGVFVGVGNCLVTTREEGKADVTYVEQDSSLSLPVAITYPDSPSVTETLIFMNALPKIGRKAERTDE